MKTFHQAKARTAIAALLAGTALLALAGCAAIPDLGPAPQPKPVADYAASKSFAAAPADWPSDNWWKAYGDAQLDSLIQEALAASPDLAQAQARVHQAEGYAQEAGSTLGPHLDAVASVAEVKQSYNMGFPPALVPQAWR